MDGRDFVERLTIAVRDETVSGVLAKLTKPAGRSPGQEVLDRAKWFNDLDNQSRYLLQSCIREAVDDAIFGMLCVLDGARAIEDRGSNGRLELHYVSDKSTFLNSPDGQSLHEFFEEVRQT